MRLLRLASLARLRSRRKDTHSYPGGAMRPVRSRASEASRGGAPAQDDLGIGNVNQPTLLTNEITPEYCYEMRWVYGLCDVLLKPGDSCPFDVLRAGVRGEGDGRDASTELRRELPHPS